jgi:hypothetical protein
MRQEQQQPSSSSTDGVSKILTHLNWPTVALIALTGGGNFLLTNQGNNFNKEELERAIRQVKDLHNDIDQTDKRQKAAIEALEKLANQNNQILQELRSRPRQLP